MNLFACMSSYSDSLPSADLRPIPVLRAPRALGNILVVALDEASRSTLSQWFETRGHFVAVAENPEAAERVLETISFDLIVSDVTATSLRGRRWLENLFVAPPCPTIFLAAHPSLETAIRIANLPLAGYLAKPIEPSGLEQVVNRILHQMGRSSTNHA